MTSCREVKEIDRLVVGTSDPAVECLCGKLGLEFQSLEEPAGRDLAYTFAESWEMAAQFKSFCPGPEDGLLVLDHRNLLITSKFIREAIALFQKSPATTVVAIAPCLDRPCQYHAFSLFADCGLIDFSEPSEDNGAPRYSRKLPASLPGPEGEQISVEVRGNRETGYILTLHAPGREQGHILHILPFSEAGTLFAESLEIFASGPAYEQRLAPAASHWKGIICILSTPAEAGEYDMVEVFSPPKAPWEIRSSGPALFRKDDHMPMHGRQQFPDAYAYDGSLCLLSHHDLARDPAAIAPTPVIMPFSRIVTDWVDYHYAAAIRGSHQEAFPGPGL